MYFFNLLFFPFFSSTFGISSIFVYFLLLFIIIFELRFFSSFLIFLLSTVYYLISTFTVYFLLSTVSCALSTVYWLVNFLSFFDDLSIPRAYPGDFDIPSQGVQPNKRQHTPNRATHFFFYQLLDLRKSGVWQFRAFHI